MTFECSADPHIGDVVSRCTHEGALSGIVQLLGAAPKTLQLTLSAPDKGRVPVVEQPEARLGRVRNLFEAVPQLLRVEPEFGECVIV